MHAREISLCAALAVTAGCGLEALVPTDLGDAPSCEELSLWPAEPAEAEEELALLVDELRRRGTTCGEDELAGVGPVELDPALRCAARRLSGDLARRDDLGHDGRDGSTTLSRVNLSGYDGITRHELLATDYPAARNVLDAWTADEDHCRYLMDKDLDHVGVGTARSPERDRIVWVLITGEERR